ncbi:MAG TPA: inositol monophosphatase family protein [Sphingomicrobium sp.]|nr:inositol monophosphatase family protein [Sphingomicrobium sp.]
MPPADFASFACELASSARRETLARFQKDYAIEDKGFDLYDPVTEADRAAEAVMRELIQERFAEHGISGEEFPARPAQGPFTWSLDPIDGTRSYIAGLPTWTTLIALLDDGQPILGLIDAPCLDETYVGKGGEAAIIRKGERSPIRTSGRKHINEARFSTTDPYLFGVAAGALQQVLGKVQVTRYGHDGYAYARLAAGSIDLVIENGLKPHDYNALIPIVRAAGGHFGDWLGGNDFAAGNVIAAASRELYDEAVALLCDA